MSVFSLTPQGKVSLSLVPIARWYLTLPLLIIKHFHDVFPFTFYSSELRSFCLIQTHLQGQIVKFHRSLNAPASCLPMLLCGVVRWWLDKENHCLFFFCWVFSHLAQSPKPVHSSHHVCQCKGGDWTTWLIHDWSLKYPFHWVSSFVCFACCYVFSEMIVLQFCLEPSL